MSVCVYIPLLIQGAYKLSEDFAKPYFHKYWTEIHDVTTIWKRNVCSCIVTLNAFDVRPTCDTADVQAILPLVSPGYIYISSSSSSVICQTAGPKPLPKRFLHIVRSRASSFNWQYPLLSLRSSSSFLRLRKRLGCLITPIRSLFANNKYRWQYGWMSSQ